MTDDYFYKSSVMSCELALVSSEHSSDADFCFAGLDIFTLVYKSFSLTNSKLQLYKPVL